MPFLFAMHFFHCARRENSSTPLLPCSFSPSLRAQRSSSRGCMPADGGERSAWAECSWRTSDESRGVELRRWIRSKRRERKERAKKLKTQPRPQNFVNLGRKEGGLFTSRFCSLVSLDPFLSLLIFATASPNADLVFDLFSKLTFSLTNPSTSLPLFLSKKNFYVSSSPSSSDTNSPLPRFSLCSPSAVKSSCHEESPGKG